MPNQWGLVECPLYKLCNSSNIAPDVSASLYDYTFDIQFSDFITNQNVMPETTMAIASLLVDSANTRTFGIPTYGFSARQTRLGGISYNCSHIIPIKINKESILISSIFARLSIEEDVFEIIS